MAINIKLNPNLFEANGQFKANTPFAGIAPNKAIVHIGTGKVSEGWYRQLASGVGTEYFRNNTGSMQIGRSGIDISNQTFEYIINHNDMFMAFGSQVVALVEEGVLQVEQDGTPLALAAIVNYAAP